MADRESWIHERLCTRSRGRFYKAPSGIGEPRRSNSCGDPDPRGQDPRRSLRPLWHRSTDGTGHAWLRLLSDCASTAPPPENFPALVGLSQGMNDNLHTLRCFGCGARIAGSEARPDFRCAICGDLFEVE